MREQTASKEQAARPKWYVKAKERMALMKRFATGTDVHLLEMACSDYDRQSEELARYENGRVVLTGEIDTLKLKAQQLALERDAMLEDIALLRAAQEVRKLRDERDQLRMAERLPAAGRVLGEFWSVLGKDGELRNSPHLFSEKGQHCDSNAAELGHQVVRVEVRLMGGG